jgi:hypothetical protein
MTAGRSMAAMQRSKENVVVHLKIPTEENPAKEPNSVGP